jgi:hypothetical protein
MKTLLTMLLVLLVSFQVTGQKKSKVDPKDAQIDSLTRYSNSLTVQLDSVSKELVKYVGVYNVVKEKVIHYNFDPTRMSYLIDSLKASRDAEFAKLTNDSLHVVATDSIPILKNEIRILQAALEGEKIAGTEKLAALSTEEIEKAKAISNLKQLKELFDNKIISEAEFIALKKKYLDKL